MTTPTEASLKLAREEIAKAIYDAFAFPDPMRSPYSDCVYTWESAPAHAREVTYRRADAVIPILDRVRAEALKEAARVADRYQLRWTEDDHDLGWDDAVSAIEQGIRALIPKGDA